MADEKPKGIDPLHDPAWATHQQRNLASGDVLLFQTEVYGTRARFYLGAPLNAKEIRWEWASDMSQEEVSALAMDLSFTAMLLARKAQGAMAHLGQQVGTLGAKIVEQQAALAALAEPPAPGGDQGDEGTGNGGDNGTEEA